MSFSHKYLDLMTECSQALNNEQNNKNTITFFGEVVERTDTLASSIICASTEEYEDALEYTDEETGIVFQFDTWQYCLFGYSYLDETNNPDEFLFNYFEELVELKDNPADLCRIFREMPLKYLLCLSTMYMTALKAKIIETYKDKYKALKKEYTGLPFYPIFDFSYSLEEYYESSTCW